MKKIQNTITDKTNHAFGSVTTLDTVLDVVAGLQRLGFPEQAATVATAAHALEEREASELDLDTVDVHAVSADSEVIALDASVRYSPADLKRMRRIARACIEEGKSVRSAKQLLRAIAAYKAQVQA